MDTSDVERAMLADWALRGADAPSWPDPRPHGGSPADDEYERVTDWSKYRVVGLRVHSWVQALDRLGVAVAEPARTRQLSGLRQTSVWLRPADRAATPVRVYLSQKDGTADSGVAIGGTWLPACGCDACDSGSEELLGQIDDLSAEVLGGEAAGDHRSWFG